LVELGLKAKMKMVRATQAIVVDRLKRDCLIAVKQWPGCETVAEIGLVREERGFALTVLNYGTAQKRLADRAVRSFQNEYRRHYHVADGEAERSILRTYHR
jgi:hypothetical protein